MQTMQSIQSWNDVTPFAGSVVAYTATSHYLGATRGYVLEDKSTYFGYIDEQPSKWVTKEDGYNMSILLKAKEKAKLCALVLSNLTCALHMRLATDHEVKQIAEAVGNNEAYFAFVFTQEKMHKLLEPRLAKL